MKKYFILAAAAITLVACNQKEMENDGVQEPKVINLTASINSGEDVTRASSADDLQNTQFVADQSIYVEAYEAGATGSTAPYTHGTYTTGAGGALTGSLYYPANDAAVDIRAYYPSSLKRDVTYFTVSNDQSTATGYRASDAMYSVNVTNKAANQDVKGELEFNHALTKIVVNVTLGNGMLTPLANNLPTITNVTIKSTIRKALFANTNDIIVDGVLTASADGTEEASDINITGIMTSSTIMSNMGIIVPQTVTAGAEGADFIAVTYNTHTYTYKLPANTTTTFQAGKVYTYELTLNADRLDLKVVSINDWTVETGEGANTGGSGSFTL